MAKTPTTTAVNNDERLTKVFKIMSFFDDMRWETPTNYNLINFYRPNLDDDTKLLTHWFCYISDRQMPFQAIWDVGGFVYSEMIDTIIKSKDLRFLDPQKATSFIKKDESGIKYTFIGKNAANPLIQNKYNKYIDGNNVKFKPRFLPSDYYSMLSTLTVLEDFDFSLTRYIIATYQMYKDKPDYITRIVFSLYLLTYHEIKQPNSSSIADYKTTLQIAKDRKKSVVKILNDPLKFEQIFATFNTTKKYAQKRAWCSFRDFLKSPEFSIYFKSELKKQGIGKSDMSHLFSLSSLQQLELPGDLWNNNSKFRKCILQDTSFENSKKSLNKILRAHFEKNKEQIIGYPEQFDISFDFVQRMCDKENCSICPVQQIHQQNDFPKTCTNNTEKYCPSAFFACNYKNLCHGINKCKISTMV